MVTPPPDTSTQQPILPELPVKVLIKQFGVQELSLGEPVVGVAARLTKPEQRELARLLGKLQSGSGG